MGKTTSKAKACGIVTRVDHIQLERVADTWVIRAHVPGPCGGYCEVGLHNSLDAAIEAMDACIDALAAGKAHIIAAARKGGAS